MFCRQCGTELASEAKFCPKCGAVVNDQAAAHRPTSQGRRLANYILDVVCFYLIIFLIGIIIGLLGGFQETNTILESILNIVGIFAFVLYYLFFEGIWARTPAKFITRTKVVMRDGSKPDFLHILGRSFARLIPFEAFSFLFGPVGWHDSLSKTLVVPAVYTAEQVQGIDVSKTHSKTSKVLIVVVGGLVLIAVVGILASVVLLSLNSARSKSRDAARVAQVRQQGAALELYYNDNQSYPKSLTQLTPRYITTLPVAPRPSDGACTGIQNEYKYTLIDKNNYQLAFCIGGTTNNLPAGVHILSQDGMDQTD